jgi:hypothetical protein
MQIQSLIDEVIMYTSNEVEVQFLRQPSAINCFLLSRPLRKKEKKDHGRFGICVKKGGVG